MLTLYTMLGTDKPHFSDAYSNHQVFEEIHYMMEFYDGISFTCFSFMPSGTGACLNYASYIYTALQGTLDSIQTLLKIGRINDAYALVRKYFDDVLLEIYIDVIRKDKYDWEENIIVKDVDEWLRKKLRIPTLKKLLKTLEKSPTTKDLYPFFGWDTYFKKYREFLDDSVHGNKYKRIILNCNKIAIANREVHLQNILIVLKQIFTMHLAFIYHMNPHYMMASDYLDYRDCGMDPPKGSECWLAPFAQESFDRYIKPLAELATSIKDECCMDIKI